MCYIGGGSNEGIALTPLDGQNTTTTTITTAAAPNHEVDDDTIAHIAFDDTTPATSTQPTESVRTVTRPRFGLTLPRGHPIVLAESDMTETIV